MSAFWTRGYDATSMADLMEAMDLRKGSIYKAFADKHDLFMQALTRYLDRLHETMRAALESSESPVEGLRLRLSEGATVKNALAAVKRMSVFSALDMESASVGVFGRIVDMATPLNPGDRVEIYRPLAVDPKQARRSRAAES